MSHRSVRSMIGPLITLRASSIQRPLGERVERGTLRSFVNVPVSPSYRQPSRIPPLITPTRASAPIACGSANNGIGVGSGLVLAFGADVAFVSGVMETGDGTDDVAALFGLASHAIRVANNGMQRRVRITITQSIAGPGCVSVRFVVNELLQHPEVAQGLTSARGRLEAPS